MATIACAMQTTIESDDNIMASSALYDSTYSLFARTFQQTDIKVRFADPRDPAAFAPLIVDNTVSSPCLCRPFDYEADMSCMR